MLKTLYRSELRWVASPGYASDHQLGDSKQDLLSHIHICETRYADKRLPIRVNGHREFIDLSQHIIHVNDPISVREAVIEGCGVSLLPDQYCKQQLADGSLVTVFEQIAFDTSASELSVIYPSRRLISNKTRAFLDFLVEVCRDL